jgi:hypothetical protein
MADKIVPIRDGLAVDPPAGTADPAVIKEIEGLLEQAKSGELIGLAYVSLHPGDTTVYFRVGRITRAVMGALTIMQYAMAKADTE